MCPAAREYKTEVTSAAILTIGNEVVSGDVANTNATWLAQRLETLGVKVMVSAAVPDEPAAIGDFVRRERGRVDFLIVTGGLGGTPDDITREALAAAFGVAQKEVPELAADLRARFPRHPDYAARWARLPAGSVPLENPHGGAPGFRLDQLRGEVPISGWRRAYRTRESEIVQLLTGATVRWPQVTIGSYPRFLPDGPEVEVVLKSADAAALAAAVAWLEPALDDVVVNRPG